MSPLPYRRGSAGRTSRLAQARRSRRHGGAAESVARGVRPALQTERPKNLRDLPRPEHVERLGELEHPLVIIPDNDPAGMEAATRWWEALTLYQHGMAGE